MIKLSTLCENYLNEHFWLADKTKKGTHRAFAYLVLAIGDKLVENLTFQDCQRYHNWLLKSGRAKTTSNIYLRCVKPVLNWAVQLGLINSNPAIGVKEFRVTQRPIKVYEDYEFARMLQFAPSDRWRAILLTARTAGLRRGEILNLTQENIKKGFIFVEPKRKSEVTWPWEPKDKEIRKVPLVVELESLLSGLTNFYPMLTKERTKTILKRQQAGLLNSSIRNRPETNFRRTFVSIQRRAFGRQIGTFHDLRKTFITQMASHLPDYFVCKLSGHSNVRTMVTYYTAVRESQFIEARKLASHAIKMGIPGLKLASKDDAAPASPLGGTGLEPVTSCV